MRPPARRTVFAIVSAAALWAGTPAQSHDQEGNEGEEEGAPSSVHESGSARHASVHIPEPMIFDLVRGLGAARGELETNVLAQFPLNNEEKRKIEWAPEIEYAILDRVALELELPFEDGELHAYKGAVQGTFGRSRGGHFIHGTQAIVETIRGKDQVKVSLLYMPGFRINERLSFLGMLGARDELGGDAEQGLTLLVNASIFLQVGERTTLGIENNVSEPRDQHSEWLVMPQVHYELGEHWSVQAGLGAEFEAEETNETAALRMIVTF